MATIQVQDALRKKVRDLNNSLGDNLLKYIAELLTNSDDSYRRLENDGKLPIETKKPIIIDIREKSKQTVVSVIDNAQGMDEERLKEVFGQYGGNNSGGLELKTRGIFGQGASDVLRTAANNKKVAEIKSIVNDVPYQLKYNVDASLNFNIEVGQIAGLSSRNRLDEFRKNNFIPENGTIVSFGIPDHVKYKKNKIKIQIEQYPFFRFLLNQENRQVILKLNGKEEYLSSSDYAFDKMTNISHDIFTFDFENRNINCILDLYVNNNKAEDGTKIIVIDDNNSVFDNTMFAYDNNKGAENLSGVLKISGLYELCSEHLNRKENPDTIILDNRDGFDTKKPFYKELEKAIYPYLDRTIKSRQENDRNTDLTKNEQFKDALNKINKYLSSELSEDLGGGTETGYEAPPEGLRFIRSKATLTVGKKYDLKLLINSSIISPSCEILIENEDENSLECNPNSISYDETEIRDNGLVVKSVNLLGKDISTEPIIISASAGEIFSSCLVNVIDVDIHYPRNGLEFFRDDITVVPNVNHEANLFFDRNTVPIGSNITLTSVGLNHDSCLTTAEEHLLCDDIGCISVKFNGGLVDNDYTVYAKCGEIETALSVHVRNHDRNPLGKTGLIAGFQMQPFAAQLKYIQSYFNTQDHYIYINVDNEIAKVMLETDWSGRDPKNPKVSKKEKRYICERIAEEAARLLVKTREERVREFDTNDSISVIDEAQQKIQEHKNFIFSEIYEAML